MTTSKSYLILSIKKELCHYQINARLYKFNWLRENVVREKIYSKPLQKIEMINQVTQDQTFLCNQEKTN